MSYSKTEGPWNPTLVDLGHCDQREKHAVKKPPHSGGVVQTSNRRGTFENCSPFGSPL
jgi:hypothetical protein